MLEIENKNVICIVIDKLIKKRHYISCIATNKNIFAKIIANILINYVFETHDLSISITSNRESQFVTTIWRFFCKRLNIKCNFFIVYYSKTDEQIERVNQNIETNLRKYYNYMQDDWFKWLVMTEFFDNDRLSKIIKLIFFFANKSFHLRMTFDSNIVFYESTRERLLIAKIEDITSIMINILFYIKFNAKRFKVVMSIKVNKHRKSIYYVKKDII